MSRGRKIPRMRGSFRGGFRRGGGGGGGGGPNGFAPRSIGAPPSRPPPFDVYNAETFERIQQVDDTVLTKDVVARGAALVPSDAEKGPINQLLIKVRDILIGFKDKPDSFAAVKIEEVREVGSFKKDTVLAGHREADLTVILSTLPTFEAVGLLCTKLSDDLRALKEVVSCTSRDYGININSRLGTIRVLITTIPGNSAHLEPDLHLPERVMMVNYHAIRHVLWFEELGAQSPLKINYDLVEQNVLSYQIVLVRVLKDVRRRYAGLQPLSVWALEYVAHFSIAFTPNRQPMSLGPAFRRFFEVLSAGIFLPGSPGLNDPTEPHLRIAYDLSLADMDLVCRTAQTLLRVISWGGHATILGTGPKTEKDIMSAAGSVWSGVSVVADKAAYKDGCMLPKYDDADSEVLAQKLTETTVN